MKFTILIVLFVLGMASISQATIYSFNPITNDRVYPSSELSPSYITDTISVRTCSGEFIAETFVVKYSTTMSSLLPVPSNLKGPSTIDAENIDIKGVKCWYQKGDELSAPTNTYRLFLPELLLNDDSLVQVNYINMNDGSNSLKTSIGYIPINNPGEGSEFAEIHDSPALLPLSLEANTNKQYWVTIYVPEGTPSGDYFGDISITNDGIEIESVNLEVEVLPFTLPDSPVEISLFYTQALSSDGLPSLSLGGISQIQLQAQFQDLKEHGVVNPIVDSTYHANFDRFNTYMQIRQAEGMESNNIYYGAANLGANGYFTTVEEVNQNTPPLLDYLNDTFGTSNLYLYCNDEVDVTPYALQIAAAHALGAKTMDAQDNNEALIAYNHNPPLLDFAVMGGDPVKSITDAYHSKNLLIGNYGNPQAGLENPEIYRRNYGLLLWQKDVDVSMTFAYAYGNYITGRRLLWNDWNWDCTNRYKIHAFAYPTTDGVVDTVQWEGFREGVNDLRYLAKLEQMISEKNMPEAEAYLASLKITTLGEDVSDIRNDIIDYILEEESTFAAAPIIISVVIIGLFLSIWFLPPLIPVKSKIQRILKI